MMNVVVYTAINPEAEARYSTGPAIAYTLDASTGLKGVLKMMANFVMQSPDMVNNLVFNIRPFHLPTIII